MKLSRFIQENFETLLQEWEKAAEIIFPDPNQMDRDALRDHAKEMLQFIAQDIEAPQTKREQADKSRGLRAALTGPSAASRHGAVRMEQGLDLTQVITEHRALRATVTRLWGEEHGGLQASDIDDLIRFNEAMDQLLSDSMSSYTSSKERQTRLFETMLASSPDQSYIFDTDGRLIYVNRAAAELFGMPDHKMAGKNLYELGMPSAAELHYRVLHVASTGEQERGEVQIRLPSGKKRIYDYLYVPVTNKKGEIEAVAGASRDITERKENEYQIWRNANIDLLTGIPNRRLFVDRLEQSLKQSERTGAAFALLFIDLDRFKEANDQLGHSGGDLLLKRVAGRISSCVRGADTVARLGGDEFTAILKDVDDDEKVKTIARKILARLAHPFRVYAQTVSISGSIGATLFPRDGTATDKLMKNADRAMYSAKQAGGDRFRFYAPSMERVVSEHSRITKELKSAVPNNELVIYYQPIVDLSSGAICKAEALLRWNHPQRGLLSPLTFIKIAEQTGVIEEIDEWVFNEAAFRSREWGDKVGRRFQISINKSSASFLSRTLVTNWISRFEEVGLAGGNVMVEFTEDALSNASVSSADLVKGLSEDGIDLAVDDFGTGQFSMASLRECGIGYLKIDQALVQNMKTSTSDRIVANAIITMAHEMGLKVVAEGVETEEQRCHLVKVGCDYAQGFMFSKPLPHHEFRELL